MHSHGKLTRREFTKDLIVLSAGLALIGGEPLTLAGPESGDGGMTDRSFLMRGVVILPEDLSLSDWPERASVAGLTTIALHDGTSPSKVARCIESEAGRRFLDKCRRLGINVEYELHAMSELLPRSLFGRKPDLFRMNDDGERTPDTNLCVHAEEALEMVSANAVAICKTLKPTTSRYFLWFDDNQPGCRCPRCREFSDSDQALILENRLLEAIRTLDPKAGLAHLAYGRTLSPPEKVKPHAGVFLEFAPINRNHRLPLVDPENRAILDALDGNLRVFGADGAQALEYWLDVSLFSSWKRPAVKVDLNGQLLRHDLDAYAQRGIRHVTTFAAYMDADYVARHGHPPITEYGLALSACSIGKR